MTHVNGSSQEPTLTVNLEVVQPSGDGVSIAFMGKLIAVLERKHGARQVSIDQFNRLIYLAGQLEGFYASLPSMPKKNRGRSDAGTRRGKA